MESVARIIIRPTRRLYDPERDLGPSVLAIDETIYKRTDSQVTNSRGLKLQCSWFQPCLGMARKLPCLLYCHSRTGSRVDAMDLVQHLLPKNITVFAFDFSGCGRSEGEYITLGQHEEEDIEAVLAFISASNEAGLVVLMGEDTGATAAILHTARHPDIDGLILTASISSGEEACKEVLAGSQFIPRLLSKWMFPSLRQTIQQLAQVDVEDVRPVEDIGKCRKPVIFFHNESDDPRKIQQCVQMYESCPSTSKLLLSVKDGSNSMRTDWVFVQVETFIRRLIQEKEEREEEERSRTPTRSFPSISEGIRSKKASILAEQIPPASEMPESKHSKKKHKKHHKDGRDNKRSKSIPASHVGQAK